ncbi:MAG: hypothetical protein AAGA54_25305 [Myxococcota bacterium]
MRASLGLFFASVLTLGGCDDAEPAPGGETGGIDDDDDGDSGSSDPSAGGTTGVSTTGAPTTDPTAAPTTDPTDDDSGPTPTTMDPSDPTEDPTDPTDATTDGDSSGGCTVGTQGCACDGGSCNNGLECVEDECVLDVDCGIDIYEDNNTESDASDLGTLTDDDDDAMTITGVLEGDETDWFTYFGDDTFFTSVNPARTLTTAGALRMCKYAECTDGIFSTEVTCPEGTASAESPEGRPGCCGTEDFEIQLDCLDAIDDDAQMYMRFDQGLGDCTQYTVEFKF